MSKERELPDTRDKRKPFVRPPDREGRIWVDAGIIVEEYDGTYIPESTQYIYDTGGKQRRSGEGSPIPRNIRRQPQTKPFRLDNNGIDTPLDK